MSPEDQEPVKRAAQTTDELRLIAFNLSAILGLGTLLSLWFLVYTDWLRVIGGLLTVTGVLAWIGLLVQLVSDDRKKEFQASFEKRVLLDPGLWKWLASGLVVLILLTAFTSTLEIDTLRDNRRRAFSVYADRVAFSENEARWIEVTPERSRRKRLFFGYGPFLVKPSGLPALKVQAGIFKPKRLVSPDDFTRSPVVLIRPDRDLSHSARDSTVLKWILSINGEPIGEPRPFRGRAIWVGSDRDTAIPDSLMHRWSADQPVPWLPAEATDPWVILKPNDRIDVRLVGKFGPYGDAIPPYIVDEPEAPHEFVQEIILPFPK